MNTEVIEDHSSRKFCCVSVHICCQKYISRFFVRFNCSLQRTPFPALSIQLHIRTLHIQANLFNKSYYKVTAQKRGLLYERMCYIISLVL